jgi:hypothetical protein
LGLLLKVPLAIRGIAMLTLLVACLLIYKLDLPQWLYLVAMAVWAIEVGVWRFTLRSEDREFVFIHDKLTEIERRIGDLRSTATLPPDAA